jgi:hypothetical protein
VRCAALRGVYALDVPARELWAGHTRGKRAPSRSDDPRAVDVMAGGGVDDCDGSGADVVPEAHGAVGDQVVEQVRRNQGQTVRVLTSRPGSRTN